jgi:quercetin dioxygenase-like cupin family protein
MRMYVAIGRGYTAQLRGPREWSMMRPAMSTLRLSPNSSVTVRSSTQEALAVEAVYAPDGSAPPKHFHPAQSEHFEVLEGSITTRVDGDERVLEAGETIDIPVGAVHQMWNAGAEPARMLWRTSPAGRTLEWFQALDSFQRDGDTAAFGAALAEYRDVFLLAES